MVWWLPHGQDGGKGKRRASNRKRLFYREELLGLQLPRVESWPRTQRTSSSSVAPGQGNLHRAVPAWLSTVVDRHGLHPPYMAPQPPRRPLDEGSSTVLSRCGIARWVIRVLPLPA
uniref:Uncharacterized protein n=1 Tax=Knipowitschia caucasica TaxID=637954 RepID=A0AAV2ITY5_KNICA